MPVLFGQLDPSAAVATAQQALEKSARFGPEMFMLMCVILIVTSFLAVWVWYVMLPNAKTHRACFEGLTQAVQVFAQAHPEILHTVKSTESTVRRIEHLARHSASAREVELCVMEKVAAKGNIDLQAELGELRGILKACMNPGG